MRREIARAWDAGKLVVLNPAVSFSATYTIWGGVLGGALLSAASHGTDHLIVQRLLAARNLPDARKALVVSGVFVIGQFALFLLVGTSLWLAGADRPELAGDALYPTFVVTRLPAGLAGLVVAAILAAAMSTVASSLNSLASASTHDFYAPVTGRRDPEHLLRAGRVMTLVWAAILVGGAMLFRGRDTPVVVLALSIASLTYGGLLGTYLAVGVAAVAAMAGFRSVGSVTTLTALWEAVEYVALTGVGTLLISGAAFGALPRMVGRALETPSKARRFHRLTVTGSVGILFSMGAAGIMSGYSWVAGSNTVSYVDAGEGWAAGLGASYDTLLFVALLFGAILFLGLLGYASIVFGTVARGRSIPQEVLVSKGADDE